jgi:hypothetical protein
MSNACATHSKFSFSLILLASNYHEVIIHPVTNTGQDVASLKHAVPNHIEMHRRVDRYEQRMVPVEMLDYGAFASFAPKYDSNSANISFESTYLAKITKQAEREADKRRSQELYGNSAIDTTWLKDQGQKTGKKRKIWRLSLSRMPIC